METRRQATPTTKLRQVLGDITNRNTFSRSSGKKVTKSPHFCSAKSSIWSVERFSQGRDFPSNVALTSGSNRKSDSLGKKRKSAISEDCDEKNRNGEMKKKKKNTRKKNEAITVEGCKCPSSGSGDIRSNSETTPDPLSEHTTEKFKLDLEIKKLNDHYADIDAYQLIEEEYSD